MYHSICVVTPQGYFYIQLTIGNCIISIMSLKCVMLYVMLSEHSECTGYNFVYLGY